MHLLFIKSLLAVALLASAVVSAFTMLEVFGRSEKRYNIGRLKKIHRMSGILYLAIFLVISYFCLRILIASKAEPSPRVTIHAILALSLFALFFVKVGCVRIYRQYYGKAQGIGIWITVMTFVMVGMSSGYYLLLTGFGTSERTEKFLEERAKNEMKPDRNNPQQHAGISTDARSIERGRDLFNARCVVCHDPRSTKTVVGPGLAGILKTPRLPASGKPATPENVRAQLRNPLDKMPPYPDLGEDEIADLVSFLNTL